MKEKLKPRLCSDSSFGNNHRYGKGLSPMVVHAPRLAGKSEHLTSWYHGSNLDVGSGVSIVAVNVTLRDEVLVI